jgi:WD40 repeat protein
MEISIARSPTAESLLPTDVAPAVPASSGHALDLPPSGITIDNAAQITSLTRLGRGVIWQMAISPADHTLAVASTTGVWLYRLPTLDFVRLLDGHKGQIFSVSWSPDGMRVAAGSGDNAIYVWDAAGWRE